MPFHFEISRTFPAKARSLPAITARAVKIFQLGSLLVTKLEGDGEVQYGLLGCWLLVCWFAGLLGCWVAGLLGCWVGGLLGCWFVGLWLKGRGQDCWGSLAWPRAWVFRLWVK